MNKDALTLQRISWMHPLVRETMFAAYDEICAALSKNVICRYARTLSSFAEQDQIWNQGRFGDPGKIVTNAKGGFSYHNYGLAADVVFLLDKNKDGTFETPSWDFKGDFDGDNKADWQEVDEIMKKHGFVGLYNKDKRRWDLPHFQKTLGFSVQQLYNLHIAGQVDKDGYVILNKS